MKRELRAKRWVLQELDRMTDPAHNDNINRRPPGQQERSRDRDPTHCDQSDL